MSLVIMNAELEQLHVWHEEDKKLRVSSAWAADSTLLCVKRVANPELHWHLEECWNPLAQQSDSAQAARIRKLLAGFDAAKIVFHLSWGPTKAAALVTGVKRPLSAASQSTPAFDRKLYVLGAGQGIMSKAVDWQHGGRLRWSPAGDRLLLSCETSLTLMTTSCVELMVLDGEPVWHELRQAVFSSDGAYIAVACACCDACLRLYDAENGEMLLSLGGMVVAHPEEVSWDLSFSEKSDQLILLGRDVHIISFGSESDLRRASSRQLCNAIAAISSQAPGR